MPAGLSALWKYIFFLNMDTVQLVIIFFFPSVFSEHGGAIGLVLARWDGSQSTIPVVGDLRNDSKGHWMWVPHPGPPPSPPPLFFFSPSLLVAAQE